MIYPIGVQSFEKMRKEGYVYVDKTALVHKLATSGSYYFLSRPRRFGKSLLISTLDAYFSGRKDLFEGLAIERLEKKWTKYPILHLDLNTAQYDSVEALGEILNDTLCKWEKKYGSEPSETSYALRFKGIVERAAEKEGQPVVILVDEYDKPMLQAIKDDALQTAFRNMLKAFYSVLKTQDRYIKFAFIAGTTEYGRLSMYPDLNNFHNISRDERYNALCGFTEEEILNVASDAIDALAHDKGLSKRQYLNELSHLYGGYHFENGAENIYHPYWIVATLSKNNITSLQPEEGCLFEQSLKKYRKDKLSEEELFFFLSNNAPSFWLVFPLLLLQYGYLTIADYNKVFNCYSLSIPNKECKEQLSKLGISFSSATRAVEEWKVEE